MDRRLSRPAAADPVAIVTAGTRGVGLELARELTRRGYALVMVYLDDPAEAEATVEELRAASAPTVAIRADIGDELDVERLFTETEAAFGGVDVVVHTTTGGSLVNQHAARRLRPGGAIVATSGADDVTPALAEQLRARSVTMNGILPGVASPGRPHDVAELLAILDGWQSASSFDP